MESIGDMEFRDVGLVYMLCILKLNIVCMIPLIVTSRIGHINILFCCVQERWLVQRPEMLLVNVLRKE